MKGLVGLRDCVQELIDLQMDAAVPDSTIREKDVYKRQGVDREEWEKSPQFHEKVMERQEHQQEREEAFLAQNRDCFAIYQVSREMCIRDSLNCMEGEKEDGCQDAVDSLLEDAACNTRRHEIGRAHV